MALFKAGKSAQISGYDFGSPTYRKSGNLSGNGTISQTTSSHAKLVIVTRTKYGGSSEPGYFSTYVWDEENSTGYTISYGSSGYGGSALTASTSYLTITDTNVSFKNASSNTQRCNMLIWC